ncbi:MAG: hypothetical protein ABI444_11055 [Candidatus Kapaibacterium sp.]
MNNSKNDIPQMTILSDGWFTLNCLIQSQTPIARMQSPIPNGTNNQVLTSYSE